MEENNSGIALEEKKRTRYINEFQGLTYKSILKKLARISIQIMEARGALVLYGTDISLREFVPQEYWDRAATFHARYDGPFGKLRGFIKITLSNLLKLTPITCYHHNEQGEFTETEGVTSFVLRSRENFYRRGIFVALVPDVREYINNASRSVRVPVYAYNGIKVSRMEQDLKVDLGILRLSRVHNFIALYIPNYGILELGNVAEELFLARNQELLCSKLDELVSLVKYAGFEFYRSGAKKLDEEKRRLILFGKERELTDLAARLDQKKRQAERADLQNSKLQIAIDDYYLKVLKMHDLHMGIHAESVIKMTLSVLHKMGCEHLNILAPLIRKHDVGKKLISPTLLSKEEKLSDKDYEVLRAHPWLGALLLKGFPGASEIDAGHHERFDGKGYPDRLTLFYPQMKTFEFQGNRVHLDLSVPLSVVGAIDAMEAMGGTKRAYRKRASIEQIMTELVRYSFTQFHPQAVFGIMETIADGSITIGDDIYRRGEPDYWYFSVENPEAIQDRAVTFSKAVMMLFENKKLLSMLEAIFICDSKNKSLDRLIMNYQQFAWRRAKLLIDKYKINLTEKEYRQIEEDDREILRELVQFKTPIENTSWYNPRKLGFIIGSYVDQYLLPALLIQDQDKRSNMIFKGTRGVLEDVEGYRSELFQLGSD